MNQAEIQEWLTEKIAGLAGLSREEVDPSQTFSWYGLDSAMLVPLAAEAEEWLGKSLSPTLLFEHPTISALAAYLARATAAAPAEQRPTEGSSPLRGEPIAIVGIGCHFPGARGPRAFWKLLCQGTDAISEVPPERWDADSYFDPDPAAPGKSVTRWGGFLQKVDHFDASFFGISNREATRMDPQQRLLLEIAWEAIEDAGQNPEALAGTDVGVYVGISHHEYSAYVLTDPSVIDGYSASGNALSISANRVSYCFDFRGPSLAIDTACSSSLYAIRLACEAIRAGQIPMALAGASNLIFWPGSLVALSKAGIMARDGRCKAFDARADGYVRGEGVGLVMLKPLSRARADGDHIYALIRGTSITQDGRTNGLMAPNARAQEEVLRKAYRDAGVDPSEIDYVEAHGTGTFLGDAIEAKALGAVVGVGRPADQPCRIGSVKTNIGHLEPAAGIAGIIKVALSLRHGFLPKNLHFETPNGEIPFGELGLAVQTEFGAFPNRGGRPALAGISSFGFGGANAHAVLEAVTPSALVSQSAGASRGLLLPLSARSAESLRTLAHDYRDLLLQPGGTDVRDICGTAALHRLQHRHRFVAVGETAADLCEQLDAFVGGRRDQRSSFAAAADGPKVAFVFSGQGSQWVGMARRLLREAPAFRAAFSACAQSVAAHCDIDLLKELDREPDASRLDLTSIAQPAIFAVQVALTHLWKLWGVCPDAVVGHSSGEIAAAHVAGILSLDDAARLVAERSRLMEIGRGKGQMASVRAPLHEVESVVAELGGRVSIAAVNGPRSVVIAGPPDAISDISATLEKRDIGVSPLRVEYAFHSAQMDDAGQALTGALGTLVPRAAGVKMYSTVTGAVVDGAALDAAYWGRNVTEPVLLHRAIERLVHDKFDVLLEVGPHPVLARDLEATLRHCGEVGTVTGSLRRELDDFDALNRAVAKLHCAGVAVQWGELLERDLKKVSVPSYPWHHERLWIEVSDKAATGSNLPNGAAHKLLGEHVKLVHTPNAHVWQNTHPVATPADRASATPCFDCASLIETVLSAGRQIGLGSRFTVTDLELVAPLWQVTGGRGALHSHALPQWAGKWAFTILRSDEAEPAPAWQTLLTAGLTAADDTVEARDVAELRALQARFDAPVSPDELHAALADQNDPTSGYRVVRELWKRQGEALAHLSVPEVLKRDSHSMVHPVVLAGCLQLFAAKRLFEGSSGRQESDEPTSIQRFAVHGEPSSSLWAHLRVRKDGALADIDVYDESGQIVFEIVGIRSNTHAVRRSRSSSDLRFYDTVWAPTPLPPHEASPGPGRWLIFADRGGVGGRVAAALQEQGQTCLVVPHPEADVSAIEGDLPVVRLDPSRPEPIAALIRDRLGPDSHPFEGVVHLWSLDAPSLEQLTDASLIEVERDGCGAVLELLQALCSSGASVLPRLWVVTRGAQPVTPKGEHPSALHPMQASVWGLTKGVEFEQPELRPTLVDLDPASPDVTALVGELLHNGYQGVPRESETEDFPRPNQIAFRRDTRYVARTALVARTVADQPRFREDASYVVTGGLGGIGLALADWMIDNGAIHLVLTSRREPDPDARAAIEKLSAKGANVVVRRCDVADGEAVRTLLNEVRSTLPPLRGVMHAAGVLDDGPLLDLTRPRLAKVLAPKVSGTVHLDQATSEDPLDFFVLFSSIASLVGNPGQGAYNAGNMFLDVLAHARRAQGRPALSISWGPWGEVGLIAKGLERMAAERKPTPNPSYLLSPKDCFRVLGALMADGTTYLCVLPGSIRQLFKIWKRQSDARELHERPNIKQEYIAPRDDVERQIAAFWTRVLGVKRVGVRDNFFELGGDSVHAGQVVTFVNRSYGVSISLRESFESFTVESLGKLVEKQLVAKLETLSEAEAARLLAAEEQTGG